MSGVIEAMGKHPFDAKKAALFIKHLRKGSFQETAADLARTPLTVLIEWGTRGSVDESEELTKFYQDVRSALAEYEAELVANVREAATKDWRAATFLLAERFSERWAGKHEPEKRLSPEEQLSDPQKGALSEFIEGQAVLVEPIQERKDK